MILGILSDTHNHLPEARRALETLLRHGAQHFVHCGDAGEDVVDLISATCLEHGLRAHIATGNCDRIPRGHPPPCPAGVERGDRLDFTLAGQSCAVLHGHDERALQQALGSGTLAYLFIGHSHARLDEHIGPTRVLNPGSCARPRGGPPTVIRLDLATDDARWVPVTD